MTCKNCGTTHGSHQAICPVVMSAIMTPGDPAGMIRAVEALSISEEERVALGDMLLVTEVVAPS